MINPANNDRVKILLITHYYPEHRGGVEIVAGKLTEYLLKRHDLEITWMSSNVVPPPVGIARLHCLPMSASNWIEKKMQIPYPIWSIPSLFKLWKAIKIAKIIHIHDYLYMSNLIGFLFAHIQKKTIIITQHIGFIPYNSSLFRGLLSFLNATLGCFILRNANQVVFISEVVQKYFSAKTRFRHPALMIPNGVDVDIYFPADVQQRINYRQELGLPIERPIFLFVGRFVEKKGLPILEQLARNFPSVYWAFAGWGTLDPESWRLPNVQVFRDRRGVQLTNLYQAANLLVLPSKGEGFPLVVQEAMACGTPAMVGSETAQAYSPATPFIFSEIVEGETVIDRWSNKIQQLLEKPDTLKELRPKVANFASQYWRWSHCAQQYYEIYEDLAKYKVIQNRESK